MEVVASLFQGRTAAAQCGLFTHKSFPVIFEPPCTFGNISTVICGVHAMLFRDVRVLFLGWKHADTRTLTFIVNNLLKYSHVLFNHASKSFVD